MSARVVAMPSGGCEQPVVRAAFARYAMADGSVTSAGVLRFAPEFESTYAGDAIAFDGTYAITVGPPLQVARLR